MKKIVLGLALLVAGLAWFRLSTFQRITGPHQVAWRAADDTPLAQTSPGSGGNTSFVLDRRLIVSVHGKAPNEMGFAWIDPIHGEAKIAWPVPEALHPFVPLGVATRGPDTFAVAFLLHTGPVRGYSVGIAGRDGWLRAPAPVLSWPESPPGEVGIPILLGMAWSDGELELVFTHPSGEDPFGDRQAPDVVRVPAEGAPRITPHPYRCERCTVVGAVQDEHGWNILARGSERDVTLIVDPQGAALPAPGALAWWGEFGAGSLADRAALGTLWGRATPSTVVERDGSRHPIESAPIADFTPLHTERFELVEGTVRQHLLWYLPQDEFRTLAQRVAGRTVVTSTPSQDDELQLVGDDPSRLHPALHGSLTYSFRAGHFLPRDDGFVWVAADGAYVTLDRNLQRTDPLSIVQHLRTRGSAGSFLDEPRHVWLFGWVLFGLPVVLVLGLGLAWARRRNRASSPLQGLLLTYVVTAGAALTLLWPML